MLEYSHQKHTNVSPLGEWWCLVHFWQLLWPNMCNKTWRMVRLKIKLQAVFGSRLLAATRSAWAASGVHMLILTRPTWSVPTTRCHDSEAASFDFWILICFSSAHLWLAETSTLLSKWYASRAVCSVLSCTYVSLESNSSLVAWTSCNKFASKLIYSMSCIAEF